MILDSTTEKITLVLAGATTTTPGDCDAAWTTSDPAAVLPTPKFNAGSNSPQTNGTTSVDLVPVPTSSTMRVSVQDLSVVNRDTQPMTVTIRKTDTTGPTHRNVFGPVTIQTGEKIQYTRDSGWNVFTVAGAVKVTAVQSTVEPGYIDGQTMSWVSATQLAIASGTCYIPSVGANVNFPSNITLTPTLSASAFHHVYAFLNSGVPDYEVSTTAPSSPYNGTARTKTGDTTRRYIGSFLTNSSSQIYRFVQAGMEIHYLETIGGGTPFRILSSGAATSRTAISTSAAVPITSRRAEFQFINGSPGSQFMIITPPDLTIVDVVSIAAGIRFLMYFPLVNGQIGYYMNAASGLAFIDVHGYSYER